MRRPAAGLPGQLARYARRLARPACIAATAARYRRHLAALHADRAPCTRADRLDRMALLAARLSGWELREPQTVAWWRASDLLHAIAATERGYVLADALGPLTGDWDEEDRGPLSAACREDWEFMARQGHQLHLGRADRARRLSALAARFPAVPGITVLDDVAATELAIQEATRA